MESGLIGEVEGQIQKILAPYRVTSKRPILKLQTAYSASSTQTHHSKNVPMSPIPVKHLVMGDYPRSDPARAIDA